MERQFELASAALDEHLDGDQSIWSHRRAGTGGGHDAVVQGWPCKTSGEWSSESSRRGNELQHAE